MKTRVIFMAIMLSLICIQVQSQGKSKKELRDEQKLQREMQTEAMVDAREFIFIGRIANPSGMRSVNMTSTQTYVKFQPDYIESEMPFFGRAYGGLGYGGDSGMKLKGKPYEFSVVKEKKGFRITTSVKGESDNFRLSLYLGPEGGASLSISSKSRSTISYTGDINAPENKVN